MSVSGSASLALASSGRVIHFQRSGQEIRLLLQQRDETVGELRKVQEAAKFRNTTGINAETVDRLGIGLKKNIGACSHYQIMRRTDWRDSRNY
jgi:hypothetical protein